MAKLILLILILAGYFLFEYKKNCTDEIEWQSVIFKVRGTFCSWEGYKALMDTLEPEEAARATREMKAVSIPKHFINKQELSDFFFELRFPGYSVSFSEAVYDQKGNVYSLIGVELPNEQLDRIVLFKYSSELTEKEGSSTKIMEFFAEDELPLGREIVIRNNQLEYLSFEGDILRAIQIPD